MITNFLFMSLVLLNLNCTRQQSNKVISEDSKMEENFVPSYVELHKQGILKERGEALWERMNACDLCPRVCKVNRLEGRRGICKANHTLEIASYGEHFGEEPELVGRRGSGTIFFTNCALLCVFCINADISHGGAGRTYTIRDLADIMLKLQKEGRHNINLVTPSHYIAHIILAIDNAASRGLRLPIVYNSSGWETKEVIQYLDGIVDIYMPDFKYGCNQQAGTYSIGAFDYVEVTSKAILEMHRQVGTARINPETGLMERGLMIRHLVMPNNASCTREVMQWIGANLPKDTYINLMSQYTPVFNARKFPEINRRITHREYQDAIQAAEDAGLTNVRIQGSLR